MRRKGLIPKRRFVGFIDSWEKSKLENLAEISTGKAFKSTDFKKDGEYLVVTNKNIQDQTKGVQSVGSRINIDDNHILKNYLLSGENILVTMDGVNIGEVGKYSNSKGVLAQRVGRINSRHLDFVYQVVSNKKFISEMDRISVGNAIKHISLQQIAEYSFKAPKTDKEQQRIGHFFKQLDEMIALQERKVEKTKALRSAYIAEMFPADGERVPKRRFAGFTEEWEKALLGEILYVNSGRDYKHLNKGDIPVYGTGGLMLLVDDKLSEVDGIGIGRKGTIDKPQYLKAPFWTVDTLYFLTPANKTDLKFMYYKCQTIDWRKMDESTGVPSLSKNTIDKTSIYLPSFKEQQKIGEFFKQLDEMITNQQDKLEKLKATKQAYLHEMFV